MNSILDVGWLHDIWRPDVFFKNAKQVTFHEMSVPNHYLWLYHDKTLIYMAKYILLWRWDFQIGVLSTEKKTRNLMNLDSSIPKTPPLIYLRLTLVLSCAMKFESYPHDTQVCSMQIESRELFYFHLAVCWVKFVVSFSFDLFC